MPSAREMRLRIRSVKNIAQVTKALETVSASKVRRSMAAFMATKPYADKAWEVLLDLARQPGRANLHPLLVERPEVKNILVVMISSDRGLAGAYNVNILRHTLDSLASVEVPLSYVAVGRKGRDMLLRRAKKVVADFSHLPAAPSFLDVSAIGRLVVDDYLTEKFDQVLISYTEFKNMLRQEVVMRKLLPLEVEAEPAVHGARSVFTYEPDAHDILGVIVPRFTALQIYRCILSAAASEHAARMVAMRNATDNAHELIDVLQLEYNKSRQQSITNEMLDITSGAEALVKVTAFANQGEEDRFGG